MIVPSIDIQNGEAVQLRGGETLVISGGDPTAWMRRFRLAGDVAVIDLDAARGIGGNREVVESLVALGRCRVGGGIRTVESAIDWLDRGAYRVILGTAARPDLLQNLPRERVIAAVDARSGSVVVEGWRTETGRPMLEVIAELKPYVGGFLVTFVEREGRLDGIDLSQVRAVIEAADPVHVTVAGGVTTPEEVAIIDRLGADCQVGVALYTGRMSLGEAIAAPLQSDRPDGLWPTVVCDVSGVALGLVYSNLESVCKAVESLEGVYWSRKRGLWVKGASSGATQELVAIDLDCDRDALRFTVAQRGSGHCHKGTWTCWGDGHGLGRLSHELAKRTATPQSGSYTSRLLADADLLRKKLIEEAGELADAVEPGNVAAEAADIAYFTTVRLIAAGQTWEDVGKVLDDRALRVTRRKGDAKE